MKQVGYIKHGTLLGAIFIALFLGIIPSAAQDGTATIKGDIVTASPDGTFLTLPGAKVTITPDKGIAAPQSVFADETGAYEIRGIAPGTYTVEVILQGFLPAKKTFTFAANQTITENIEMAIDPVAATIDVRQEQEGLQVGESQVTQTVGQPVLQDIPLANEKATDALPLTPGVVRGPDGLISVKGAQASQSGTLVGTSNVDDPVTGNASFDLPLEAVEEIKVVSNPFSAEYGGFSGGVVQLQTRSGADKWKFGFTRFFPRFRERDGKTVGVESATPRLTFSGPLKKDKLFLFQTFEYRFIRTKIESIKPEIKADTVLESFNNFTRVDYNVTDTHRINFSFALFPQKLDFVNLNTFNPQDTSANFHQRGWMFAANDQYVTSKGAIWQTTVSVKAADADVFGNSSGLFTLVPDLNTGGFYNRQERDSTRIEAQTIYTMPEFKWGGAHQFKFGGGFSSTSFDGTSLNQPVAISRVDGTLSGFQSYTGDGILDRDKTEIGFFVQDKWTPITGFSLDYGVRFDRDNLSDSFNPAPRIGFAYSPFKNNKTVVRGGFGVFVSKVPINVAVFDRNQDVLVQRFAADGVTLVSSTQFRNVIENDNVETPYSLGWTFQLDRELSERFMVRVGYEQRETRRDYILNPIVDSNDPTQGLYFLGKGGSSSYREFLLMTRVRLQTGRELFFSFTQSRSKGDLNNFGSFIGNIQNPILRDNEYSRLSVDVPRRFLVWGDIALPWKITFSPVVDWRNGFPFSVVDENLDFVGRRNFDRRFPIFFSADIQVLKQVMIPFRGKKYRTRVGFKIFNITNHFNPRDVQNNITSHNFGGFFNGVGRTFRAKFEMDF